MYSEILLDCRELEPPEPLNLVTNTLIELNNRSYIKMLHRIEPTPLLSMLNSNGYEYITKPNENEFIIYIWSREFKNLAKYIKEL